MSVYSLDCSTTEDTTLKPLNQCYNNVNVNGRIHSLVITGPGVQIPCYTDSDIVFSYISRDANYPATMYNSTTAHPQAGAANPNNSQAHLIRFVEGELGEPTTNEGESARSFDKPSYVIDVDFAVDIKTYYKPENQAYYEDIANGKYGEVFVTFEDAVGFKVAAPTVALKTYVEDEELIVVYSISWTQDTALLPLVEVPEPLYSETL